MSYLVYVNMQKSSYEKVYADMHKTDGHFYLTEEAAQAAIDGDPELSKYKHVVPCVVMTEQEYNTLVEEADENSTRRKR